MADINMFINRLRKNVRHWGKWARRNGISCYRIYDRDIPEFPVAIDRYDTRAHLQVFETAWEADEALHEQWRRAVQEATAEVLEIAPEAVAVKYRRRQKGKAQYEKQAVWGQPFVVEEGGHRFEVDLDSYLDTGLFLDHRNTRQMVQERAVGKRFLNLFSYTGSFTVYAAAGGARETTTVDMSNTYLKWAKRNFQLNGMDTMRNHLVREDVFTFLDEQQSTRAKYDLIVMDPPSFSNSKKMQEILDVQRDHPRLINGCLKLLAPGGELFFSTNRKRFKLDEEALAPSTRQEITNRTVPEDFQRSKPHRCWLISRA